MPALSYHVWMIHRADEQFTTGNTKTLTYNCPATGWMNVGN
jgi:hypothetical protein